MYLPYDETNVACMVSAMLLPEKLCILLKVILVLLSRTINLINDVNCRYNSSRPIFF